jgi:hypothetical protein
MTDASAGAGSNPGGGGRGFDEVKRAIQANLGELRGLDGVVAIRPGYKFEDGWITNEPAIILSVDPEVLADPAKAASFPTAADGVPIDLTPATPIEQLRGLSGGPGARAAGGPDIKVPEDDLALPGWQDEAPAAPGAEPEVAERKPTKPYIPPPGLKLAEVKDGMTITCHCSPDAGFTTLKPFLEGVEERFTVAMYDFTAPHIVEALSAGMEKASGDLDLNLDPGLALSDGGSGDNPKAKDIDEDTVREQLTSALGDRFKFTWAAVLKSGKTTGGIFPSAYHIKVAVRDGKAFWLSSGNWQSSNQPDLDPIGNASDRKSVLGKFNREWNIVVQHPGLARLYEQFIQWDIKQTEEFQAEGEERGVEQALPELLVPVEPEERGVVKFFEPKTFKFTKQKPLQVQPVLTPDNYAEMVLKHIQSAKKSVYFQNQYIHINKTNAKGFDKLVDALLGKMKAGLDVRIILRDIGDVRKMLEALQLKGFDMKRIKLQKSCHNKGIIVDSKVVALGSHNWSSDGTTANRDATLILHDPAVAAYYEQVFQFDWDNQSRQKVPSAKEMPVVAKPGRTKRRDVTVTAIPWASYYED